MGIISKETLHCLETQLGFKRAKFHDYWVHPKDDTIFHIVTHPKDAEQYDLTAINSSIKTVNYGIMGKRVCKPLYKTFRFNNKNHALHVLKGLAFLSLDKFAHLLGDEFVYEDLRKYNIVINHKDGDRFNNNIDNLEWTTQRENTRHAVVAGMRSDTFMGMCYDVVRDKEFPFFSISTLGKKIKVHPDAISRYLKTDRTTLLAHRYMLRRDFENDYPCRLTKDDCWKLCLAGINPIKVLNTETGQVRYFPSKKLALELTGPCDRLKSVGFKHHTDVIQYGHFEISPVNDYNKIMELKNAYDDPKGRKFNPNLPLPVIVTLSDGSEMTFSSSKEAGEYFGTNREVVKARILRNEGYWRDLHFRYVR